MLGIGVWWYDDSRSILSISIRSSLWRKPWWPIQFWMLLCCFHLAVFNDDCSTHWLALQSNDFALGIPIMQALYPSFTSYIYLFAPISFLVLNPIAFCLMEYGSERNSSATVWWWWWWRWWWWWWWWWFVAHSDLYRAVGGYGQWLWKWSRIPLCLWRFWVWWRTSRPRATCQGSSIRRYYCWRGHSHQVPWSW